MVSEVVQQLAAVRGVHDLGVEHRAVIAAGVVGDDGERRALAAGDHAEARRQAGDAVAVAHPHLLACAGRPYAVEQVAVVGDVHGRCAELVMLADADLAAQMRAHRLLAVADAEHRQAAVEHQAGHARAGGLGDAGGAAGQDIRAGVEGQQARRVGGRGHDLAIHAGFADPPGDQLGELAAEIQDQHAVPGGKRFGHGEVSSGGGHGGVSSGSSGDHRKATCGIDVPATVAAELDTIRPPRRS